ncbi:hypothetical protein E2C01_045434 [Portunus trituberculatus]|uniref:Uncharacterized protein n=1 Tax=Portunus trituberculatus TaxID=210409 RepID=A0A5B7G288_PORTR|nr:hypothetical protein [Portunus trituberculatus]
MELEGTVSSFHYYYEGNSPAYQIIHYYPRNVTAGHSRYRAITEARPCSGERRAAVRITAPYRLTCHQKANLPG